MSTALSASQQQSAAPPQDENSNWKQQLAERLDAYRAKHQEAISSPSFPSNAYADSRASRIARSVASRYAAAPTYSELLQAAAQAEQAAAEAQAALSARLADDARAAQEQMDRDRIAQEQAGRAALISRDSSSPSPSALNLSETGMSSQGEQAFADRYGSPIHTQPGTPVMPQFAARTREMHVHQTAPEPEPSLEDLWASALVEPRALLPSKLIEFPRELVSSRRARPRLPQNPDGEPDATAQQPEPAQLRIFEVQPETELSDSPQEPVSAKTDMQASVLKSAGLLSGESAAAEDASKNPASGLLPESIQNSLPEPIPTVSSNVPRTDTNRISASRSAPPIAGQGRTAVFTPRSPDAAAGYASKSSAARSFKSLEWAAISLDKEPAVGNRRLESSVVEYIPFLVDPASIDRRLMAFAVDFAAVTAGFMGFLVVFVASTPHPPTGLAGIALAGAVYVALWVLYQMLFFSLSGATAGMLYAHIALCTFDDQNPTRSALRRRVGAWWLSCVPMGLGFLWCFVDEDNLSWHDRMTRTYQRGY